MLNNEVAGAPQGYSGIFQAASPQHPVFTVALCCEIVFSSWAAVALHGITVLELAYKCTSNFQVDSWGDLLSYFGRFLHISNTCQMWGVARERRCSPATPGFLISTSHRERGSLRHGDALMGDRCCFPTLRVSVWHRWSRHPCVQRALRSLPVPRAHRGEDLPSVSPLHTDVVKALRVLSVPAVLGQREAVPRWEGQWSCTVICHLDTCHWGQLKQEVKLP